MSQPINNNIPPTQNTNSNIPQNNGVTPPLDVNSNIPLNNGIPVNPPPPNINSNIPLNNAALIYPSLSNADSNIPPDNGVLINQSPQNIYSPDNTNAPLQNVNLYNQSNNNPDNLPSQNNYPIIHSDIIDNAPPPYEPPMNDRLVQNTSVPPPENQEQGRKTDGINNSEVIIIVDDTKIPRKSFKTKCPNCNKEVKTKVIYEDNIFVWIFCMVLCIFTGCCCCLPFFINDLKDAVHHCPNCKSEIARNNRTLYLFN